MKESFNTHDLKAVANRLADFEARCEEMMELLNEKHQLRPDERSYIEALFRSLKEDLKRAAKYGTITGERRPQNRAEQCFYDPAVRRAAIDLRPATNSHPITSRWFAAICEAKMEFSYYRNQIDGAHDS
jgi:hypothetical protein